MSRPKKREASGRRRPGRHRPTEARKLRALPLLIAGWKSSAIAAELRVSPRTVERWIAEDELFINALAEMGEASDIFRAKHLKLLESLGLASVLAMADAVERGDAVTAAKVLTMTGVGAPKKLEHELGPATNDAFRQRIAEILAKRRQRGDRDPAVEAIRMRQAIGEIHARVEAGELTAEDGLAQIAQILAPAEAPGDEEREP